jgi:hypothetical protein
MCISIITTCILNLYIGNCINICCAVKIIYKSWLVVFYKKKQKTKKKQNPDTNKVFSQLLFRKVIKKESGGC